MSKHPANYVGASNERRPDGDFYPTPAGATLALLNHIPGSYIPNAIWEPACGDGAISRILEKRNYVVVSSDLHDRGYGTAGVDFFEQTTPPAGVRSIITNPPYEFRKGGKRYGVEDWIEHAWAMPQIEFMALFMKTVCLAGKRRSRILETSNFERLLQFRQRVTLRKNGIVPEGANTSMIDFAWFIFGRYNEGPARIFWIEEVAIPTLIQGMLPL